MRRLLTCAALALGLPAAAHAQALSCDLPARISPYPPIRPDGPTVRVPVGGFTFALSWSPEFCHSSAGASQPFQCGSGNRFGFVVHGLWAEGANGQSPQWCQLAPRPAPDVLRGAMCMTPSAKTLEHEWLKHGSCAFKTPAAFFDAEAQLWRGLQMPDMVALAGRPGLSAGDLRAAFVAANPSLKGHAFAVKTGPGGWLREVDLCYSARLSLTDCAGRAMGARDATPIRISSGR